MRHLSLSTLALLAVASVGTGLAVGGGSLLAPARAPGTSTTKATADTYVRSDAPAQNYGSSVRWSVDGRAPVARNAYLKFTVPAPAAGQTLSKVTLSAFTATAAASQGPGPVLYTSSNQWSENGLVWGNQPAAGTRVATTPAAYASRAWVTWDVTSSLTADQRSSGGIVSFRLQTTERKWLGFKSREAGTALAPKLNVTSSDTSAPSPSPTPTPTSTPTPAAAGVTKLLLFVEENRSLSQMQSGMPYAYSLAKQYGYATNYTAIQHPSLPNYIAIAGGQTYGVTDDNAPSSHELSGQTVFGQALAAGKTAKMYADGMPSNCALTSGGTKYAVKHNPWAYFTSAAERAGCSSYDVPETELQGDITAGTLPNVGMVVPNLCNDAHDCSLSTADNWFQLRMQAIMAGPDWKAGRLAVVLTADEDDSRSGNKVLTMVIHPSQRGHVVTTALTHYSLTRLFEDVAGTPRLFNAATAPSMSDAFDLPVG